MDLTSQNKSNQEELLFEILKNKKGSCLLFELRHAEHAGSDLLLIVGRPNLEIILETRRNARCPNLECQLVSEVRSPTRARGEEKTLLEWEGKGYNPCLLGPCNRRRLEARSFTQKRDGWNSIKVLVSLVNLWTESKLWEILRTWSTLFKRKEWVGIESWVVPTCLMGKKVSLPTRICSEPEYSSAWTFKFARSWVRWWVAPESGYQLGSTTCCWVARRACIWGVLSMV